MSNLGWYQEIVTLIKKLGGPKKAVGIIGAGTAAVGIGLYELIKRAIKKLKSKDKRDLSEDIFTITNDSTDNQGLAFKQHEQYLLLESDYKNDTAIIEKPYGSDNVFAVSIKFLIKNSNATVKSFNNGV